MRAGTPISSSLSITEVGDLLGWLERPPTKLVVVDDPEALDAFRPSLVEQFGDRLFIAKSLPYFLELASPRISKGSGLGFVAEHLGFTAAQTVAFGDGENDLELLGWAGYGVCVENGERPAEGAGGLALPRPGGAGGRAGDRGLPRLPRMIDLKAARNDPDAYRAALARKGAAEAFDAALEADERWRALVPRIDELRGRRS